MYIVGAPFYYYLRPFSYKLFFTARCYLARGIATASRLSVRPLR